MEAERAAIATVTEIPRDQWTTWKIERTPNGDGWVTFVMVRLEAVHMAPKTLIYWKTGLGGVSLLTPTDFTGTATFDQQSLKLSKDRGIPPNWFRAAQ